jgi:hypothetical protein
MEGVVVEQNFERPFSINLRSPIGNHLSNYRLLVTSILCDMALNRYIPHNFEFLYQVWVFL